MLVRACGLRSFSLAFPHLSVLSSLVQMYLHLLDPIQDHQEAEEERGTRAVLGLSLQAVSVELWAWMWAWVKGEGFALGQCATIRT